MFIREVSVVSFVSTGELRCREGGEFFRGFRRDLFFCESLIGKFRGDVGRVRAGRIFDYVLSFGVFG